MATTIMATWLLVRRAAFSAALAVLLFGAAPRALRLSAMEEPELGVGGHLNGRPVLPPASPWNQEIADQPVDPHSGALLARIGLDRGLHADFGAPMDGVPNGIPYVIVDRRVEKVPIRFEYSEESDPGPYPVPKNPPIEGGPDGKGDRHILILDRDEWKLYELFAAYPEPEGAKTRWKAGSGAIFDLRSGRERPAGWTSADAAGLPIFPGLARYEEVVEQKAVRHALRFTCRVTRRAYVAPARHFASKRTEADLPPMGMRVRLKADYDLAGFPASARVILTALKRYGMILADNGSDWYISGAPDPRWNDEELAALKKVKSRDLEVVKMSVPVTR